MFTNKLACLVKLISSKSAEARSKKRRKILGEERGKTTPFFFFYSFLFFVIVIFLLSFTNRKLSFAMLGRESSTMQATNKTVIIFRASAIQCFCTLFCSLTKRRLRKKLEKIEHSSHSIIMDSSQSLLLRLRMRSL